MTWRCGECGRTYEDPPETCVCGAGNLEPGEGGDDSRFSLLAVRRRLLDPGEADRSLVSDDTVTELLFRVVLLVVILGGLALGVRLLL